MGKTSAYDSHYVMDMIKTFAYDSQYMMSIFKKCFTGRDADG